MYYSIPEARRATVLMKDTDTSNLGARPSLPSSSRVTRRTCVSFECHPDLLLLDELLNDEGEIEVEDSQGSFDLESFMAQCTKQK